MNEQDQEYDVYWEDIKSVLRTPASETALVSRLKERTKNYTEPQKILEYFKTKNLLGSHHYSAGSSRILLYYLQDQRVLASGTPSTPLIKGPEPEAIQASIKCESVVEEKENGEVNSSTPPGSQSKSTPVTPLKQSPGAANHLDRPMSDSLRQKLKRRRPLRAPSLTSADDDVHESPAKRQRTSLHGPSRSLHAADVSEREKERQLRVELFERKSALERLKKKIQAKKNSLAKRDEIEHLQGLIGKWRTVAQEALTELWAYQNRHSIEPVTLGQLLTSFHLDPALVHYAADIDGFK